MPDGYVGWVSVRYGEKDATALEVKNGIRICRIPDFGLLRTSSPIEEGWAKDEYFYYSQDGSLHALKDTGWGKGGMIWGGSTGREQTPDGTTPTRVAQYFYVGTEEQYHRAVSSLLPKNPTEGQFVALAVTKIENVTVKDAMYRVQFRIKNIGDVPIFCPGKGPGKPYHIDIDTLEIEMQQPDGSWKALPEHRELPALEKVEIGVNEQYDDEFGLDNPYFVSQWMSFPRKPYSIPLQGKQLRLSVGFFVSEKGWENYVSALMRNERPSAVPQRQVHSQPFTLP